MSMVLKPCFSLAQNTRTSLHTRPSLATIPVSARVQTISQQISLLKKDSRRIMAQIANLGIQWSHTARKEGKILELTGAQSLTNGATLTSSVRVESILCSSPTLSTQTPLPTPQLLVRKDRQPLSLEKMRRLSNQRL